MLKIKLVDKSFSHNPECSFGAGDLKIKPNYFQWDRSGEKAENDIVVLTESCMQLVDMQQERIKILLILEPPCISKHVYDKISQPKWYGKFDYILTYNPKLLCNRRFYKYTFGGCWIRPEDRAIHQKTKNISIIASWKKETEGQKLRHEIISRFGNQIDVYGNGYKFVENKIEALKDYRYSIVVENERSNYWFTEKILDCFAVGTIPIYWGCLQPHSFFNCHGMIEFDTIDQLEGVNGFSGILEKCSKEHYLTKLGAIFSNSCIANEFYIPEDRIYLNFFKPVLGL